VRASFLLVISHERGGLHRKNNGILEINQKPLEFLVFLKGFFVIWRKRGLVDISIKLGHSPIPCAFKRVVLNYIVTLITQRSQR
jgi:hypothetical protein